MGNLFLFNGFFLALNALKQLMEGIGELLHAFILELLGHLVIVDADVLKGVKFRVSLRDALFDTKARLAVIFEVLNSFQRHRIHGVQANEFLRIEHIAVCRIFGTGASPQRPLYMSALLLEFLETRRVKEALELLVDDTGIGDGGLALK